MGQHIDDIELWETLCMYVLRVFAVKGEYILICLEIVIHYFKYLCKLLIGHYMFSLCNWRHFICCCLHSPEGSCNLEMFLVSNVVYIRNIFLKNRILLENADNFIQCIYCHKKVL